LFAAGRITVVTEGSASRQRTRITEVTVASDDLFERSSNTPSNAFQRSPWAVANTHSNTLPTPSNGGAHHPSVGFKEQKALEAPALPTNPARTVLVSVGHDDGAAMRIRKAAAGSTEPYRSCAKRRSN